MIKSFNKQIGCAPIVKNTIEAEVKGGFATVKNKAELIKLKVLFSNSDGPSAGDSVFILGDQVAHSWATTVYEVDGVRFIMVPLSAVHLVECDG